MQNLIFNRFNTFKITKCSDCKLSDGTSFWLEFCSWWVDLFSIILSEFQCFQVFFAYFSLNWFFQVNFTPIFQQQTNNGVFLDKQQLKCMLVARFMLPAPPGTCGSAVYLFISIPLPTSGSRIPNGHPGIWDKSPKVG